jgi:outer membrane protein TolC
MTPELNRALTPPTRTVRRWIARASAMTFALSLGAVLSASAQQTPRASVRQLSLDDALRLAESQSEAVEVARAGVTRATGQRFQTRSQYLPQINGTAGYTRTLRSQFQGIFSAPVDTGPPAPPALCAPNIPANATQAERNAAIAQATTCPSAGGGFDFGQTGFGAENQWTLGLQVSQNLFTGGRLAGQTAAADAQLRSATIEAAAQRAQVLLDATQAYYDAVLADQLVSIADSSLAETDEVLRQTKLGRQVGNQSEFELLRAQVTRDNQLPILIQQRSAREVSYLRLKQLLNIPLDDSLMLTSRVEWNTDPTIPMVATANATADTVVADRAPVRQLEQAVRAQEGLLKAAKAERIPSVALVSNYQRLFFPANVFPNLGDARQNWTIGLSTSLPIFTGGRIKGSEIVAQAALDETRARLKQTREFAELDTRIALNALAQAEAVWRASQGTAEQARRAYAIDQVRYKEGISTQTDLSQSRLLLEQAVANRALAGRNYAVARVRLALLKDLPLQAGTSAAGASAAGGTSGAGAQQQQQQQQQRATQQSASGHASPIGGGVQP